MKSKPHIKKKKLGAVLIAALLLFVPNLIKVHLLPLPDKGYRWEAFDSKLVIQVQTVDKLLRKTDSIAEAQQLKVGSQAYVETINAILKERFYHGYSHYGLHDNWIAALLGKFVWTDLSAVVLPDDILKYPMGACSQQSIVLMEALKRKGIDYRKVGFDHHYALEAKTEKGWLFFDPNMEPEYTTKATRTNIDSIFENEFLYTIYRNRLDSAGLDWGLANRYYGPVNAAPAPNAALLHKATKILSKLAFLVPFCFLIPTSKEKIEMIKSIPIKAGKKSSFIFI